MDLKTKNLNANQGIWRRRYIGTYTTLNSQENHVCNSDRINIRKTTIRANTTMNSSPHFRVASWGLAEPPYQDAQNSNQSEYRNEK